MWVWVTGFADVQDEAEDEVFGLAPPHLCDLGSRWLGQKFPPHWSQRISTQHRALHLAYLHVFEFEFSPAPVLLLPFLSVWFGFVSLTKPLCSL